MRAVISAGVNSGTVVDTSVGKCTRAVNFLHLEHILEHFDIINYIALLIRDLFMSQSLP